MYLIYINIFLLLITKSYSIILKVSNVDQLRDLLPRNYEVNSQIEKDRLSDARMLIYDLKKYLEQRREGRENPFLNKLKKNSKISKVVKRIVRHDQPINVLEYNKEHDVYYRPLLRVHQTRPGSLPFVIKKFERNIAGPPLSVRVMEKHKEERFKKLLKPLFKNLYNSDNLVSIPITKLKARILDWNRNDLRTSKFQKSGEANDPFAPGKKWMDDSSEDNKPLPVKKPYPEYSYWDHWTYSKPIYHDRCPNGLIEYGHLCIMMPPH